MSFLHRIKDIYNLICTKRRIRIIAKKKNTIIGDSNIPKAVMTKLGSYVVLGKECHIYKDSVSVGDGTYISGGKIFYAKIGKYNSIGYDVCFGAGEHRLDSATTYPIYSKTYTSGTDFYEQRCCVIGNGCWIGNRVIIRQGCRIGNGSVIGSGAVVTHDIPPYSVFAGVPARKIRDVVSLEDAKVLECIQWWNWERDKIVKAAEEHAFESVSALFAFYEKNITTM